MSLIFQNMCIREVLRVLKRGNRSEESSTKTVKILRRSVKNRQH